MKDLADRVRSHVSGLSDEDAVKLGVAAGILETGGGSPVAVDVPPGGGKRRTKSAVDADVAAFVEAVIAKPGGHRADYVAALDGDDGRTSTAALKARESGRVRIEGIKRAARYYPAEAA